MTEANKDLRGSGEKVFSLFLKNNNLFAMTNTALCRWSPDLKCDQLALQKSALASFNCGIVVNDEIIVLGSVDGSISLFEARVNGSTNNTPLSTVLVHKSWISCLTMSKGNIISSSFDDEIRVWKLVKSNLECIHTWKLPSERKRGIYCIVEWYDYYAVGTNSREIFLLNQQGETVAILQGHSLYVFCLAVWEGKLVSGSGDNTIRVWNWNSIKHQIQHNKPSPPEILTIKLCDRVLRGHKGTVRSLLVWHSRLFSASSDGTVRLWNSAGHDIRVLKPYNKSPTKLEIRRMIIWQSQFWCALANNTIVVFHGKAEHDLADRSDNIPWHLVRWLWVGRNKEAESNLAKLPREILLYIITYI